MRTPVVSFIVLLGVASATPHAQNATPSQNERDTQAGSPSQAVNADELGVSIDRIRLKFKREALFSNVFDPQRLKLTTSIQVVGQAPAMRLFGANAKEELTSHAVPFGAPTHRDMLDIMTPQEFRTPPMDLTAILKWLTDQLEKKKEGK